MTVNAVVPLVTRTARSLPALPLALVACLVFAASARAQGTAAPATVSVTVTDASGGVVADAALVLVNDETRRERGATVDGAGVALFEATVPGTYTLVAERQGFASARLQNIVVAGRDVRLAITLQVADIVDRVTVVETRRPGALTSIVSSPSLRLDTPLLETPQAIVSVGSNLLEARAAVNVSDALRNVSGVTRDNVLLEVNSGFQQRGTSALNNLFKNGVGGFQFGLQEDPAIIDRIEFVKGPAGFMLSNGEPGGLINISTKQATRDRIRRLSTGVGSFGEYRVAADLGGAVREAGRVSYRLNVAYTSREGFQDFTSNKKLVVAPVVRVDLGPRTYVSAEYNGYLAELKNVVLALRQFSPKTQPEELPISFSLGSPNSPGYDVTTHYGRLLFVHSFSPNWKLTAQLGTDQQRREGADVGSASSRTGTVMRQQLFGTELTRDNRTGQGFVSGLVNTGPLEHRLLIGYDGGDISESNKFLSGAYQLGIDINNPQYTYDVALAQTQLSGTARLTGTVFNTVYVQDNIKIADRLIATVAGRLSRVKSEAEGVTLTDNAFTPRAGLTYLVSKNVSVYGLYDQAFIAQAGTDFDGNRFDPLTGTNIEVGAKGIWFDGPLVTNVAFYNITKNNALTADPLRPLAFQVATGQVESTGFEVDAVGAVTRNLSVSANYAWTDARVTKDTNANKVNVRFFNTPRHLANVWARYQVIDGRLAGLGLGMGVSRAGEREAAAGFGVFPGVDTRIPGYTLLESTVSYVRGRYGLNLFVDNLADERYLIAATTFGGVQFNTTPGAPRSFRLTLTTSF